MFRLSTAILVFIVLMTSAFDARAAQCKAVFTDAISANTVSGSVQFSENARLSGTDGVIDFRISRDDSVASCETQSCSTGSQSADFFTLADFEESTSSIDYDVRNNLSLTIPHQDADQVRVRNNASLHINGGSGVSRVARLRIEQNTSITLSSGDYWIRNLSVGRNSRINLEPGARVRIYVRENFSFGENVQINLSGNPDQLVIVAYKSITQNKNGQINGYVYSRETARLRNNGRITGAVSAKNVRMENNSTVTLNIGGIDNVDFGGLCSSDNSLPLPIIHYTMDSCSLPESTITDDINAVESDVKGSVGRGFQGPYCQNLTFDGSDSYVDIPDSNLFNLDRGSFSAWLYIPNMRHSGSPSNGRMTLLSKDATGYQLGGHLTIWIDDYGRVRVRHQSSNSERTLQTGRFLQENKWHHIVYSWGSEGMKIYVDGILRSAYTSFRSGLGSNGTPTAIGANAWQYDPGSSATRASQMRDYFRGAIDEIQFYDRQLSNGEVNALFNVDSEACTDCSNDPVEISHWSADVCSFEDNELIDVVSGHNGVIRQGISNIPTSRFCQGLGFDGNGSYITIDHHPDMEVASGAISFWVKLQNLSHSNRSSVGGQGLFSKDSINFGDGGHLYMAVDSRGRLNIRHQTRATSTNFRSSSVIQQNQWHHIVYSFGPSGMALYVDSVKVLDDPTYTNSLFSNKDDWVLGATSTRRTRGQYDVSQYNDFLSGEIDSFRLYQNQPSQTDIDNWYAETASNCTTCSTLIAHYSFDDVDPDTNQILDISGNGRDGQLFGDVSVVKSQGNVYCAALQTDDNRSRDSREFFNTGINLVEIGNQGTVSLWYRHNARWDDGVRRKIFDASSDRSGGVNDSKYFFLSKLENGGLGFGIEDINDRDITLRTGAKSFEADEWVYISVTYNMVTRDFNIYINGQRQSVTSSIANGLGAIGNYDTLVFGDNRSDYLVSTMTGNAANGQIDDIRIYSQAVSQAKIIEDMDEAESCEVIDHYFIEHPATALTCASPEVIVRACANEDCSELVNDPVSINLTPSEAFNPANLTFTGSTVVELINRTPGTFTINTNSRAPDAEVRCSNGCQIEYQTVGLEFFDTTTSSTIFDSTPIIGGQSLSRIGLRAVGGAGVVSACQGLAQGQQSINLTYTCTSPASASYSPNVCQVPFAGVAPSGGASSTGTVNLTFDANGEADFSAYQYADVGLVQLTATTSLNGVELSSNQVTVGFAPQQLTMSSNNNNPQVSGEEFTLSVSALGVNGEILPSYQSSQLQASLQRLIPSDSAAADASLVVNNQSFVQSSVSPTFSNAPEPNFTQGTATMSSYMEEVGSYQLSLQDTDYLGRTVASNTLDLGRFIPAYFDVQAAAPPQLENTCSDTFTYVGQTFGVDPLAPLSLNVMAYNAIGQLTQNYSSNLWGLYPDQGRLQASLGINNRSVYSGNLQLVNAGQAPEVTNQNAFDGNALITVRQTQMRYAKVVAPTGTDASPFEGNMDITFASGFFNDADGVCYQSNYPNGCEAFTLNSVGGNEMRYGRLALENTYGPETEALRVPIRAEYLVDGQWRINTADSCTSIAFTQSDGDLNVIHDPQSPANLAQQISGLSSAGNLLAGVSDLNDLLVNPPSAGGTAMQGGFYLQLSTSTSPNDWAEYLNIDWDGDGDIDADDTPTAAVSFGLYRGNDKTIHWREVF